MRLHGLLGSILVVVAGFAGASSALAAGAWEVALPPFKMVEGKLQADPSAPMAEWAREGSFSSEEACLAELRTEADRIDAAVRVSGTFQDARLTGELKLQVIEAVRRARCVAVP